MTVRAIRARGVIRLREGRERLLALPEPPTRRHAGLDLRLYHLLWVPMQFMALRIALPASVTVLLVEATS